MDQDFERFTWGEYSQLLEKLHLDISEYLQERDLTIDAVVPIMRGGGVAGTYLTYQLGVLGVFPVHYHYDFREEGQMSLRRLTSIQRYLDLIPEEPALLLVEGNQCYGNTANAAVEDIRTHVGDATILYATDLADYGHRNAVDADTTFIGAYTNECSTLTPEEAEAKNIFPFTKLLPWELDQEEKETLATKQFQYKDLESFFSASDIAKKIHLSYS